MTVFPLTEHATCLALSVQGVCFSCSYGPSNSSRKSLLRLTFAVQEYSTDAYSHLIQSFSVAGVLRRHQLHLRPASWACVVSIVADRAEMVVWG